jgi:ribonuclease BN (tRNA processing enzyme)
MSPVVFPVSFEELDAQVEFRELAEGRRSGQGYEVSAMAVRHPGGALGYRFSTGNAGDRALVYVSDNELSNEARYEDSAGWRERLVEFVRGASVLVHDTMYTSSEYGSFVGWGHSTHDQAVELALDADVERLVLFHHRPERSDDEVDRCVERCRAMVARRGRALEVVAAAEGMSLQV